MAFTEFVHHAATNDYFHNHFIISLLKMSHMLDVPRSQCDGFKMPKMIDQ